MIAAGIGFWAAWRQRRRDGRDRFLATIGELEAELDECGHIDDQAEKFYIGSLPQLRSAVFAVQPFVSQNCFVRLLALWHEYKKLNDDQISTRGSLTRRTAHELNHGKDSPNMPPYPDERLRSYMKTFQTLVG